MFQIFDDDGDGLLSYQEFVLMMKDRVHRGLKHHTRYNILATGDSSTTQGTIHVPGDSSTTPGTKYGPQETQVQHQVQYMVHRGLKHQVQYMVHRGLKHHTRYNVCSTGD